MLQNIWGSSGILTASVLEAEFLPGALYLSLDNGIKSQDLGRGVPLAAAMPLFQALSASEARKQICVRDPCLLYTELEILLYVMLLSSEMHL